MAVAKRTPLKMVFFRSKNDIFIKEKFDISKITYCFTYEVDRGLNSQKG